MPQSLVIGFLVLGGVLLLVAITGGQFKLFGAEIEGAVSSKTIRLVSGVLGAVFILFCIGKSSGGGDAQLQTASGKQIPVATAPTSQPASDSGSSGSPPNTSSSTQHLAVAAEGGAVDSGPANGSGAGEVKNSADPSDVSGDEYAIVFDPPSNVRVLPTTSSLTLCSVTSKRSIRILGSDGNFYKTDICGTQVGYIHRSQVKF